MNPIIKVNGVEVKDALCVVDSLSNIVTLEVVDGGEEKLNMDKVYVEVNIFGKVDF